MYPLGGTLGPKLTELPRVTATSLNKARDAPVLNTLGCDAAALTANQNPTGFDEVLLINPDIPLL